MTIRIPMLEREALDADLAAMLETWEADGGDPNFMLMLSRLPEALKRFGPFSPREKAALRHADRMYADHHKVDDVLWAELRAVFTDDEVLELSWAIGEFIALGTIIYVLRVPYGAR